MFRQGEGPGGMGMRFLGSRIPPTSHSQSQSQQFNTTNLSVPSRTSSSQVYGGIGVVQGIHDNQQFQNAADLSNLTGAGFMQTSSALHSFAQPQRQHGVNINTGFNNTPSSHVNADNQNLAFGKNRKERRKALHEAQTQSVVSGSDVMQMMQGTSNSSMVNQQMGSNMQRDSSMPMVNQQMGSNMQRDSSMHMVNQQMGSNMQRDRSIPMVNQQMGSNMQRDPSFWHQLAPGQPVGNVELQKQSSLGMLNMESVPHQPVGVHKTTSLGVSSMSLQPGSSSFPGTNVALVQGMPRQLETDGQSNADHMKQTSVVHEPPVHCDLCDVSFSTEKQYTSHCSGFMHTQTLENMRKKEQVMAKDVPSGNTNQCAAAASNLFSMLKAKLLMEEQTEDQTYERWYCKLCSGQFNEDTWIQHTASQSHCVKYLEMHLKMGHTKFTTDYGDVQWNFDEPLCKDHHQIPEVVQLHQKKGDYEPLMMYRSGHLNGFHCRICPSNCQMNRNWLGHVQGNKHKRRCDELVRQLGINLFMNKYWPTPGPHWSIMAKAGVNDIFKLETPDYLPHAPGPKPLDRSAPKQIIDTDSRTTASMVVPPPVNTLWTDLSLKHMLKESESEPADTSVFRSGFYKPREDLMPVISEARQAAVPTTKTAPQVFEYGHSKVADARPQLNTKPLTLGMESANEQSQSYDPSSPTQDSSPVVHKTAPWLSEANPVVPASAYSGAPLFPVVKETTSKPSAYVPGSKAFGSALMKVSKDYEDDISVPTVQSRLHTTSAIVQSRADLLKNNTNLMAPPQVILPRPMVVTNAAIIVPPRALIHPRRVTSPAIVAQPRDFTQADLHLQTLLNRPILPGQERFPPPSMAIVPGGIRMPVPAPREQGKTEHHMEVNQPPRKKQDSRSAQKGKDNPENMFWDMLKEKETRADDSNIKVIEEKLFHLRNVISEQEKKLGSAEDDTTVGEKFDMAKGVWINDEKNPTGDSMKLWKSAEKDNLYYEERNQDGKHKGSGHRNIRHEEARDDKRRHLSEDRHGDYSRDTKRYAENVDQRSDINNDSYEDRNYDGDSHEHGRDKRYSKNFSDKLKVHNDADYQKAELRTDGHHDSQYRKSSSDASAELYGERHRSRSPSSKEHSRSSNDFYYLNKYIEESQHISRTTDDENGKRRNYHSKDRQSRSKAEQQSSHEQSSSHFPDFKGGNMDLQFEEPRDHIDMRDERNEYVERESSADYYSNDKYQDSASKGTCNSSSHQLEGRSDHYSGQGLVQIDLASGSRKVYCTDKPVYSHSDDEPGNAKQPASRDEEDENQVNNEGYSSRYEHGRDRSRSQDTKTKNADVHVDAGVNDHDHRRTKNRDYYRDNKSRDISINRDYDGSGEASHYKSHRSPDWDHDNDNTTSRRYDKINIDIKQNSDQDDRRHPLDEKDYHRDERSYVREQRSRDRDRRRSYQDDQSRSRSRTRSHRDERSHDQDEWSSHKGTRCRDRDHRSDHSDNRSHNIDRRSSHRDNKSRDRDKRSSHRDDRTPHREERSYRQDDRRHNQIENNRDHDDRYCHQDERSRSGRIYHQEELHDHKRTYGHDKGGHDLGKSNLDHNVTDAPSSMSTTKNEKEPEKITVVASQASRKVEILKNKTKNTPDWALPQNQVNKEGPDLRGQEKSCFLVNLKTTDVEMELPINHQAADGQVQASCSSSEIASQPTLSKRGNAILTRPYRPLHATNRPGDVKPLSQALQKSNNEQSEKPKFSNTPSQQPMSNITQSQQSKPSVAPLQPSGTPSQQSKPSVPQSQQSKLSITSSQQSKPSITPSQQSRSSITLSQQSKPSVTPLQQSKSSVTPSQQSKPSVTPSQQSKSSVTPSQQSKPSITPSQQSKPSITPSQQSRSSITLSQQSKPSVTPSQQSKSSSIPSQQSKPSFTSSQQSKPIVTSAQQSKPSVTPSQQTKLNVTPSLQAKPSVTPVQQSKPSVTLSQQSKPSVTPAQQSKPSVTPAQQSKPSVTQSQQSKSRVTPSQQSKPSVTPSQQSKPSVTPSQQSKSSVTPSQQSKPSVTPSQQSKPSVTPSQQSKTSAKLSQQSKPCITQLKLSDIESPAKPSNAQSQLTKPNNIGSEQSKSGNASMQNLAKITQAVTTSSEVIQPNIRETFHPTLQKNVIEVKLAFRNQTSSKPTTVQISNQPRATSALIQVPLNEPKQQMPQKSETTAQPLKLDSKKVAASGSHDPVKSQKKDSDLRVQRKSATIIQQKSTAQELPVKTLATQLPPSFPNTAAHKVAEQSQSTMNQGTNQLRKNQKPEKDASQSTKKGLSNTDLRKWEQSESSSFMDLRDVLTRNRSEVKLEDKDLRVELQRGSNNHRTEGEAITQSRSENQRLLRRSRNDSYEESRREIAYSRGRDETTHESRYKEDRRNIEQSSDQYRQESRKRQYPESTTGVHNWDDEMEKEYPRKQSRHDDMDLRNMDKDFRIGHTQDQHWDPFADDSDVEQTQTLLPDEQVDQLHDEDFRAVFVDKDYRKMPREVESESSWHDIHGPQDQDHRRLQWNREDRDNRPCGEGWNDRRRHEDGRYTRRHDDDIDNTRDDNIDSIRYGERDDRPYDDQRTTRWHDEDDDERRERTMEVNDPWRTDDTLIVEDPATAPLEGFEMAAVFDIFQESIQDFLQKLKEQTETGYEGYRCQDDILDSLNPEEREQVMAIQHMTGIEDIGRVTTALRALLIMDPKVVETLGTMDRRTLARLSQDNKIAPEHMDMFSMMFGHGLQQQDEEEEQRHVDHEADHQRDDWREREGEYGNDPERRDYQKQDDYRSQRHEGGGSDDRDHEGNWKKIDRVRDNFHGSDKVGYLNRNRRGYLRGRGRGRARDRGNFFQRGFFRSHDSNRHDS